jgi:hypothetical protein
MEVDVVPQNIKTVSAVTTITCIACAGGFLAQSARTRNAASVTPAGINHPSIGQAACGAIQPRSRVRLDRNNWHCLRTVKLSVNSSTKFVTFLGSFHILLDLDMLLQCHGSDTCDALEYKVHMVNVRHLGENIESEKAIDHDYCNKCMLNLNVTISPAKVAVVLCV